MPRASRGALIDSFNVATLLLSFCRTESLRDTAGGAVGGGPDAMGPRVPHGLSKGRLTPRSESYADAGPEGPSCQRTNKERASVMEGATGAAYPGVTYREVHHTEGPTRLAFRAYWRQANCNPSLPLHGWTPWSPCSMPPIC
jgi:hypothetical protein